MRIKFITNPVIMRCLPILLTSTNSKQPAWWLALFNKKTHPGAL